MWEEADRKTRETSDQLMQCHTPSGAGYYVVYLLIPYIITFLQYILQFQKIAFLGQKSTVGSRSYSRNCLSRSATNVCFNKQAAFFFGPRRLHNLEGSDVFGQHLCLGARGKDSKRAGFLNARLDNNKEMQPSNPTGSIPSESRKLSIALFKVSLTPIRIFNRPETPRLQRDLTTGTRNGTPAYPQVFSSHPGLLPSEKPRDP